MVHLVKSCHQLIDAPFRIQTAGINNFMRMTFTDRNWCVLSLLFGNNGR